MSSGTRGKAGVSPWRKIGERKKRKKRTWRGARGGGGGGKKEEEQEEEEARRPSSERHSTYFYCCCRRVPLTQKVSLLPTACCRCPLPAHPTSLARKIKQHLSNEQGTDKRKKTPRPSESFSLFLRCNRHPIEVGGRTDGFECTAIFLLLVSSRFHCASWSARVFVNLPKRCRFQVRQVTVIVRCGERVEQLIN